MFEKAWMLHEYIQNNYQVIKKINLMTMNDLPRTNFSTYTC